MWIKSNGDRQQKRTDKVQWYQLLIMTLVSDRLNDIF